MLDWENISSRPSALRMNMVIHLEWFELIETSTNLKLYILRTQSVNGPKILKKTGKNLADTGSKVYIFKIKIYFI